MVELLVNIMGWCWIVKQGGEPTCVWVYIHGFSTFSLPFLDMGVFLLHVALHWLYWTMFIGLTWLNWLDVCLLLGWLWLAHVVFGNLLGPFYKVVGCPSIHLFSY